MKLKRILAASIGILALAAVLTSGVWFYASRRPGINLTSYQKIEKGMTREEVYAILGGPPRWEVQPQRIRDVLHFYIHNGIHSELWCGTDGVIWVIFSIDEAWLMTFEELSFEPRPLTLKEVMFPWTRKATDGPDGPTL